MTTKKQKAEIGKAEIQPHPIAEARQAVERARGEELAAYRERVRLYKAFCDANAVWMDTNLRLRECQMVLREVMGEWDNTPDRTDSPTRYPEHKPDNLEMHEEKS